MTTRRSVCYVEPKVILAGAVGTWRFTYSPASNLPKNTKILFDFLSRGKEPEWQLPQVNLKVPENLIWMELPDGEKVGSKPTMNSSRLTFQYEFSLPRELKVGENLTIFIGTPSEHKDKYRGNRSQCFSKRRRLFHIYIDPKGKGEYKDPELFGVDVRGNELQEIRLVTPSIVAKNSRFDIFVRFEDSFGNLTGIAPEDTLIELSYKQLRENLNWKLFVPETGFLALPNLYFNEPGLYHLQLKNQKNNQVFSSSPIICTKEETHSIFWGLFHGESDRFDATEQIESNLRFFRDGDALQFYGISPFESEENFSSDEWKAINATMQEFNEDGRFSLFSGFQWVGSPGEDGVRLVLYQKDSKSMFRKKESKTTHVRKIYKSHTAKELQGIPCFTMAKSHYFDFSTFDSEHEHVVEIYNAWGSSECLEKEGNPRPIKTLGKKGTSETAKGSIRNALNKNYRFGFVAGGLDDRGIYSELYDSDQVQYSPGLTAVLAPIHSRDSIFQALQQRLCFATTGVRMIVHFSIAEKPMGSELSTRSKPGLAFNRHITGYVAGLQPLKQVTIIRNGEEFKHFYPEGSYFELTLDDNDLLTDIVLNSNDERPPFIYYYLRAIQADGHIAWSSPIWVDYIVNAPTPLVKKIKKIKR